MKLLYDVLTVVVKTSWFIPILTVGLEIRMSLTCYTEVTGSFCIA